LATNANAYRRFKDIGYQHIPFLNCPNSPKCKGCVKGKMWDGKDFLKEEDCRPNWFKYIGNEWATDAQVEREESAP